MLRVITSAAAAAVVLCVAGLQEVHAQSNWSGFYGGLNAGSGWSTMSAAETPFGSTATSLSPLSLNGPGQGFLFGAQAGYNFQAGAWVLGLEGDFDRASINASQQATMPNLQTLFHGTDGFMAREQIEWLASLRARVGMAWDRNLLYATGGPAWEGVTTNAMVASSSGILGLLGNSTTQSFFNMRGGFVVGAGYERQIASHWTLRGEYLFYEFAGDIANTMPLTNCTTAGCGVNVVTGANDVSVFRVAVNYKLDGGESTSSADATPSSPTATEDRPVSWTGFYGGVNGGGGWARLGVTEAPFGMPAFSDFRAQSVSDNVGGFLGGVHAGYNQEVATWLVGLEGDYDRASINGSQQFVTTGSILTIGTKDGLMAREQIDWLASLRLRAGKTWDRNLVYATGGLAWAGLSTNLMLSGNALTTGLANATTANLSETRMGYVFGVGYERLLTENWSLRAEYLYYGFDSGSTTAVPSPCGGGCGFAITTPGTDVSVVRAGVTYKL